MPGQTSFYIHILYRLNISKILTYAMYFESSLDNISCISNRLSQDTVNIWSCVHFLNSFQMSLSMGEIESCTKLQLIMRKIANNAKLFVYHYASEQYTQIYSSH